MAVRADAVEYDGIVAAGGRVVVTARALAAGVIQAELKHFGPIRRLTPLVGERPGGDYSLKTWTFDMAPPGDGAGLHPSLPLEKAVLAASYLHPTKFELRLRVIGLNATHADERDVSVAVTLDGALRTGLAANGQTGATTQTQAVIVVNRALTIFLG